MGLVRGLQGQVWAKFVVLSVMGPKSEKIANLAQILTCMPLMRTLIHQHFMLEVPQSLISPHKLVIVENVLQTPFKRLS